MVRKLLTLEVVTSRVKWIPPAGSFDGRSKDWTLTPSFKPLKPLRVTFLVGREIPGTDIPGSHQMSCIHHQKKSTDPGHELKMKRISGGYTMKWRNKPVRFSPEISQSNDSVVRRFWRIIRRAGILDWRIIHLGEFGQMSKIRDLESWFSINSPANVSGNTNVAHGHLTNRLSCPWNCEARRERYSSFNWLRSQRVHLNYIHRNPYMVLHLWCRPWVGFLWCK